eukprot:CAMPEP_0178963840 /NCGR_PEP_ID=MMETSP0789-20121207/15285_1 /TAXON_ID=3005 /ORGANISM="Rhizosolenia setigera, Strain CCMP 1694" /LENGTH=316 /DNA_ID=CAMNT_0020648429 /DNA_START=15 /DNA_END=968 /DNA_ORIENTATION=-
MADDYNSRQEEEEYMLRLAIEESLKENQDLDQNQHNHKKTENKEEEFPMLMGGNNPNSTTNTKKKVSSTTTAAATKSYSNAVMTSSASSSSSNNCLSNLELESNDFLTTEELDEIKSALLEAEDLEQAKSMELAMLLQNLDRMEIIESNNNTTQQRQHISFGGNSNMKKKVGARDIDTFSSSNDVTQQEKDDDDEDDDDDEHIDMGFRLNSNVTQNISSTPNNKNNSKWKRYDGNLNYIVNPENGEIRSKHDLQLKGISNAQRLFSQSSNEIKYYKKNDLPIVGDQVYNQIRKEISDLNKKGKNKNNSSAKKDKHK